MHPGEAVQHLVHAVVQATDRELKRRRDSDVHRLAWRASPQPDDRFGRQPLMRAAARMTTE
jgi:hypothetical protein